MRLPDLRYAIGRLQAQRVDRMRASNRGSAPAAGMSAEDCRATNPLARKFRRWQPTQITNRTNRYWLPDPDKSRAFPEEKWFFPRARPHRPAFPYRRFVPASGVPRSFSSRVPLRPAAFHPDPELWPRFEVGSIAAQDIRQIPRGADRQPVESSDPKLIRPTLPWYQRPGTKLPKTG